MENKKKKNWFIRLIRSLIDFIKMFEGLSLIAFISLFLMIDHTAAVYLHFEPDPSTWTYIKAYVFGFVMDIAVLVFVVRGMINTSYFFSFIQVCINLLYYYYNDFLKGIDIIGAVFLSIILPYVIAKYSHLIKDIIFRENELKRKKLKEEQKEKQTKEVQEKINEFNQLIEDKQEYINTEIEDFSKKINDIELNNSAQYKKILEEIKSFEDRIEKNEQLARAAENKAIKGNRVLHGLKDRVKDVNKELFNEIEEDDISPEEL